MRLCVCVYSIRASETDSQSHRYVYRVRMCVWLHAYVNMCVCVCSGQSERGNVVKDFCGIFNVCY